MATLNSFSATIKVETNSESMVYTVPMGKTFSTFDLIICALTPGQNSNVDVWVKKATDVGPIVYLLKGFDLEQTVELNNLTLSPNDIITVKTTGNPVSVRCHGYEQVTNKLVGAGVLGKIVSLAGTETLLYNLSDPTVSSTNGCIYISRTEKDTTAGGYETTISIAVSRGLTVTEDSYIVKNYLMNNGVETFNYSGIVLSPGERIIVKSTDEISAMFLGLEFLNT
jgi:hypothetical protein